MGRGLTASLVVVGFLAVVYVKFKETIKLAISGRNVNQPKPMANVYATSFFGNMIARNCENISEPARKIACMKN